MPREAIELEGRPLPFVWCPGCGEAFFPLLRGQVQRSRWRWSWRAWQWLRQPHCALICGECFQIVSYEEPS